MERIFITGVKGMLGQAVVPVFRQKYEIFPLDLGEPDICNADLIIGEIVRCKPKYVLHLAAMTDVDGCETNPDEAYRVNALGTRNVALACQRSDAALIYIGTGMTYSGTKETAYIEFDPPDPANVYALSKYQGELIVKELLSRFYIFYSCWLFGGGSQDKKFVGKIVTTARQTRELRVVNDKFGSPTYTVDFAQAMFDFIDSGLYGKYHCANLGVASRFEMAKVILKSAAIDGCRLVPVLSDAFPLPAPRPRMEALRNYSFELLGLPPMRRWQEALAEYVRTSFL